MQICDLPCFQMIQPVSGVREVTTVREMDRDTCVVAVNRNKPSVTGLQLNTRLGPRNNALNVQMVG